MAQSKSTKKANNTSEPMEYQMESNSSKKAKLEKKKHVAPEESEESEAESVAAAAAEEDEEKKDEESGAEQASDAEGDESDDENQNKGDDDNDPPTKNRKKREAHKSTEPKLRTDLEKEWHESIIKQYPPFKGTPQDAAHYYSQKENKVDFWPLSTVKNRGQLASGKPRYKVISKPFREQGDIERRAAVKKSGDIDTLDRIRDWYIILDLQTGLDHWCIDIRGIPGFIPKQKSLPENEEVLCSLPLEKYKTVRGFTNLLYGTQNATIVEDFKGLAPMRLLLNRYGLYARNKQNKSKKEKEGGENEEEEHGSEAGSHSTKSGGHKRKPSVSLSDTETPTKGENSFNKKSPKKSKVPSASGVADLKNADTVLPVTDDQIKMAFVRLSEMQDQVEKYSAALNLGVDEVTAKFLDASLPDTSTYADAAVNYLLSATPTTLQKRFEIEMSATRSALTGEKLEGKYSEFIQMFKNVPENAKPTEYLNKEAMMFVIVPTAFLAIRRMLKSKLGPSIEKLVAATTKSVEEKADLIVKAREIVSSLEARDKNLQMKMNEMSQANEELKAENARLRNDYKVLNRQLKELTAENNNNSKEEKKPKGESDPGSSSGGLVKSSQLKKPGIAKKHPPVNEVESKAPSTPQNKTAEAPPQSPKKSVVVGGIEIPDDE